MAAAERDLHPDWHISDYVKHFAGELLVAPDATNKHVIAFRNYIIAICLHAEEETGDLELVSAEHINGLYTAGLRQAIEVKNMPPDMEIATLRIAANDSNNALDGDSDWKQYYLRAIDAIIPPLHDPTPEQLLGGLATGILIYEDTIEDPPEV